MIRITFTSGLQRYVQCPSLCVEGRTVAEALNHAFEINPLLRHYILDDQGRLRRHVNVFVANNLVEDRINLSDPIADDEELYVIQALSGG